MNKRVVTWGGVILGICLNLFCH